jgi:hypothetical protein
LVTKHTIFLFKNLLDMILHCLDHVGNVERAFGYKRKLNIYAKNGLIWRVTILEVLELRDVSLVLKKCQKSIIKREQ